MAILSLPNVGDQSVGGRLIVTPAEDVTGSPGGSSAVPLGGPHSGTDRAHQLLDVVEDHRGVERPAFAVA
jgi:hypothetical protein